MNSKWQWIDDNYGPMGWFSDAEKIKNEGTRPFLNGHWKELAPKEVTSFLNCVREMAYSQS